MSRLIALAISLTLLPGLLTPAAQAQPEAGRFRTSRWQQSSPLAIQGIAPLTHDPRCGKRMEWRIDLSATFRSPYDADEIAVDAEFHTPSGKTVTVPAFFYQRFERRISGSHQGRNAESVVPAAPPDWRVRFLPAEPGPHQLTVRARDRSGSLGAAPVAFTVGAAPFRGFIRVSAKAPEYFEFDDGTPYFAIGMNLAEGPLAEYYRWIPKLAKSGGNFARIWLGHPNFTPELGRMGEYRLENAWRFDQVLDLAEEHGLYLKLCVDWIRNLSPSAPGKSKPHFALADYPYSLGNGGPCRDMADFFRSPEARRRFQNRLRYIVARWGYSPNVMAWELWNEFDTVERQGLDRAELVKWSQDMLRHLRAIDPYGHLTTNSLGSGSVWPELWRMPETDFVQMHGYYYFTPSAREEAKDTAAFMVRSLAGLTAFGKPRLFAEFGLVPEVAEIAALRDPDPTGIHLHNGLWAPLATGAAGTGHVWYWGQYVDPKDLYYHFSATARFTEGVPWTTAGFKPAKAAANREEVRVLGLQGMPMSILWVQNTAHTWWNVARGARMTRIDDAQLSMSGMPNGQFRIEFWDTYTGQILDTTTAQTNAGILQFPTPAFDRDLAIKILPAP